MNRAKDGDGRGTSSASNVDSSFGAPDDFGAVIAFVAGATGHALSMRLGVLLLRFKGTIMTAINT